MNKVVFGALGVLVVLIALSLFLTSFIGKKVETRNENVTPIPTQTLSGKMALRPSGYYPERTNNLSDDQQKRLDVFLQKGDIETDKFSIAYSPFLNQFFIQKKASDAEAASNSYLQENNILDIKNKVPGLFVVTDDVARQAVAIAEDKVRNEDTDTNDPGTGPLEQQKDIKLLTDMTIAILNIGKKAGGGGAANCPQAKGNEKILCAARAYNGLPYLSAGPGQFYGHPPSAWVAGYESGNPAYKNLDCSGLVNVAMFKAMGQDMQAFSGTYYNDSRFVPVDLSQAKPGDLVIMGGPNGVGNLGHIAIFESFDGNNLQVFNSAGRGVRSESGSWMRTRSGFAIRRYIGPGSTP